MFGVPSVVRLSTLSRSEEEHPSDNQARAIQPEHACVGEGYVQQYRKGLWVTGMAANGEGKKAAVKPRTMASSTVAGVGAKCPDPADKLAVGNNIGKMPPYKRKDGQNGCVTSQMATYYACRFFRTRLSEHPTSIIT